MLHKFLLIVCTLGVVGFIALGFQWGTDACYHRGSSIADVGIIHLSGIIAGLISGLLIIEITRED
jgi:hypothetical protein